MNFTAPSSLVQASASKEVKDINFESQNFIEKAIVLSCSFTANQVVYVKAKRCYAKILTVDREKDLYTLKRRGTLSDDSTEEISASKKELSTTVRVKVILNQKNKEKTLTKHCLRFLDIQEPISAQLADVGKLFILNGTIIDSEVNAQELNLLDEQVILAMGVGQSKVIPKDWIRTQNYRRSPEFRCRSTYYDAVKFRTRGDTTIYGFMWGQSQDNQDFTLQVSWTVNDEPFPEDHEFNIQGVADLTEEDGIFRIDFQDHGIKPVQLAEGDVLNIRAKPLEDSLLFGYVEDGYFDCYHDIEGQENMFWTRHSSENRNRTYEDSGMFPGLLYFGGEVNESIKRFPSGDYDECSE